MLAPVQNASSTSITHIRYLQAGLLNNKSQANHRHKHGTCPGLVSAVQEDISLRLLRHELNTVMFSPTAFRQRKRTEKPSPDRYSFVSTDRVAEESGEWSVDRSGPFPALWLVKWCLGDFL